MELKPRLKLIADMTPTCNTLCDIGTDHGYLPIYLVKRGVCIKAIASDVKKGPINAAKGNIREYELTDRIETRLGNGLETIRDKEAEVIIIAGMGGVLIKDILARRLEVAKSSQALILQPMNGIDVLREWLNQNGFEIMEEALTSEGDKIYNVLSVKYTGNTMDLSSFHYFVGPKLVEKKDPLLEKWIGKWKAQLKKALKDMEAADEKVDVIRKKYQDLIENMEKVETQLQKSEKNDRDNKKR